MAAAAPAKGAAPAAKGAPARDAGGWLLALVVLGLMGYYAWRGPIELHGRPTGRLIERFTAVKRVAHWTLAISFVALAVSGLIITFGKAVLLPLIGYTLFSWLATLSQAAAQLHGPAVHRGAAGVHRAVRPRQLCRKAYDMQWLAKFGGMLDRSGKTHVPSGKFNAGEKVVVLAPGCVLLGDPGRHRAILDFPEFRSDARDDAARQPDPHGRGAAGHRDGVSTSTSARSACAAPTTRCATAMSTRRGRRSTTNTGTTMSSPARSTAAPRRPPAAAAAPAGLTA